MLRIGLIQMLSEKGAIDQNLQTIARCLDEARARREARARQETRARQEARAKQIDILGFPEMSITGYADPTRCPQAVIRLDGPEVRSFLDLTHGLDATVLAGLIELNEGQDRCPAGKPFITQIAARDGQLLGYYRKVTIKDDEVDWFSPGSHVPVFQRDELTFGISICADISNEAVFADCARQGARIVFELAAPGLYGEQSTRNWQSGFDWWRGYCREKFSFYAKKYGLWIAVATQAGRTVDEDFPGGGYVFAPTGQCLFATPDWSPGEVFLELDLDDQRVNILRA